MWVEATHTPSALCHYVVRFNESKSYVSFTRYTNYEQASSETATQAVLRSAVTSQLCL
jgi:hypothetical protein